MANFAQEMKHYKKMFVMKQLLRKAHSLYFGPLLNDSKVPNANPSVVIDFLFLLVLLVTVFERKVFLGLFHHSLPRKRETRIKFLSLDKLNVLVKFFLL